MKLNDILLILNCVYVAHATTYKPGSGIVPVSAQIEWEPYQLVEVPQLSSWKFEWKELKDLNELNFKLFLTAMYLKQGHHVYWNYKVNRSTKLPLFIPSKSLGYLIPDLDIESYKSIKHFRTIRLNQKMKKGVRIYLIHLLRPNLANKNPYWKSLKWIKKEFNQER